eukprot:6181023-Pleurochrysis_carterae.AAC.1
MKLLKHTRTSTGTLAYAQMLPFMENVPVVVSGTFPLSRYFSCAKGYFVLAAVTFSHVTTLHSTPLSHPPTSLSSLHARARTLTHSQTHTHNRARTAHLTRRRRHPSPRTPFSSPSPARSCPMLPRFQLRGYLSVLAEYLRLG